MRDQARIFGNREPREEMERRALKRGRDASRLRPGYRYISDFRGSPSWIRCWVLVDELEMVSEVIKVRRDGKTQITGWRGNYEVAPRDDW